MTMRKGQPWGERRKLPADLPTAGGDARAADLIATGCRELVLTGGDLWSTVGGTPALDDEERTVVPVDSLWVEWTQDGVAHSRPVLAHAVIGAPPRRSFRRAGDVVYVMNAQYLGPWDMAPRGHPNDGRFDVVTVAGDMSWRQRRQFRRRLPTGTHLPHPCVRSESFGRSWMHPGPGTLTLDGCKVGRAEDISIDIRPDSLTVWI